MRKNICFCIFLITMSLLLAGMLTSCTTAMKQQSLSLPANPERGKNWALATIEYDDHGILYDRNQLTDTMKLIREKKTNGPVSLILFVHGWMHDASLNDKNREDFKKFILNFASFGGPLVVTNVSANRDRAPQNYIGVYLAWRGNVCSGESKFASYLPKRISFWNRKRVATEVAGVSTTEAILSVAAETRLSSPNNTNDASEVILIGHSFGGLILERAVNQAMLGSLLTRSVLVQPLYEEMVDRQQEVVSLNPSIENRTKSIAKITNDIAGLDSSTNQITSQIQSNDLNRIRLEANTLSEPELELGCSNLISLWNTNFKSGTGSKFDAVLELQTNYNLPALPRPETLLPPFESHDGKSFLTNAQDFVNQIILSKYQISDNLKKWNDYDEGAYSNLVIAAANYANASITYSNCANILQGKLTNYIELQVVISNLQAERKELEDERIKVGAQRSNLVIIVKAQTDAIEKRDQNLARIASLHRILNRPPADLVLLVNPASDSLEAKKMIDALGNPLIEEWSSNANDSVRPWIISISSKGDLATHVLFPIGQYLSFLNKKFRNYASSDGTNDFTTVKGASKLGDVKVRTAESNNRRRNSSELMFYTHTAPQNEVLLSHRLQCIQTNIIRGTNVATTDIATWLLKANLSKHTDLFNVTNQILVTDGRGTNVIYSLNPNLTNRINLSGYWVIQAPRELIPGHSAIFTKEFYAVAAGLYRISKLYDGAGDTNSVSQYIKAAASIQ